MPVSTDDLDEMFTAAEAAKKIRVTYRHFQRIIAAGEIDYLRLGSGRGRIYITRRALTEYLNRHSNPARKRKAS